MSIPTSQSLNHHQTQQQKKAIRHQVRKLRNEISGAEAKQAGLDLAERLKSNTDYIKAKRVACFISFDGEIDTQPVIDLILEDKDICYLPKIKPTKPNRLWFMPYDKETQLVKSKLLIPEVDLPVNQAIAVSKLDMILMPLVAFDEQGNRLGMGGGYYDATLAHFSQKPSSKPQCIGIAYQQQMVEQIPTEEWDFALDGVLTQNESYSFSF